MVCSLKLSLYVYLLLSNVLVEVFVRFFSLWFRLVMSFCLILSYYSYLHVTPLCFGRQSVVLCGPSFKSLELKKRKLFAHV